jgi:hypothetical protein
MQMENELEVTRTRMEETRASLSEKLETLEQQVVETVRGATNAVAETVATVKDAVRDTVGTVQDTLDLRLQVRRHPWTVVVGSIALGYLGGCLLFRNRPVRSSANGGSPPAPPDRPRSTAPPNGVVQERRSAEAGAAMQPRPEGTPAPAEPDWLSGIHSQFGAEIAQLKGLAIGTVLSVVRDLILQSMPEQRKPELTELMDGITVKLGGHPVQGPVFEDGAQAGGSTTGAEREEHDSSARRGPRGASQRPSADSREVFS